MVVLGGGAVSDERGTHVQAGERQGTDSAGQHQRLRRRGALPRLLPWKEGSCCILPGLGFLG